MASVTGEWGVTGRRGHRWVTPGSGTRIGKLVPVVGAGDCDAWWAGARRGLGGFESLVSGDVVGWEASWSHPTEWKAG